MKTESLIMLSGSHKGAVYPRYGRDWYERNHSSCLEKGAAFGIATGLKVLPLVLIFNARRVFTGGTVKWLPDVLFKSLVDTGMTAVAVGTFLGSYCAMNNAYGLATIATAATSAGVAACTLAIARPRQMPGFFLGGAVFAGVVWMATWQLQALAEEKQ